MYDKVKRTILALALVPVLLLVPCRAYAVDGDDITNWASLEGWFATTNGTLQLILGEIQLFNDADSTVGQYIEQIKDSVSDLSGKLQSQTNSLTSLVNKLNAIGSTIETSYSNSWGLNQAINSPTNGSVAWYLKQLYQAMYLDQYNSGTRAFGWNQKIGDGLEETTDSTPYEVLQAIENDTNFMRSTINEIYGFLNPLPSQTGYEKSIFYWLDSMNTYLSYLGGIRTHTQNTYQSTQAANTKLSTITEILRTIRDDIKDLPMKIWTYVNVNAGNGTAFGMFRTNNDLLTDIAMLLDGMGSSGSGGGDMSGVENALGTLNSTASAILAVLATPNVEDVVGEFDYDGLLSKANSLTDRLKKLAPFAAFAVISSLFVIWSQSSLQSAPSLDVPFNFYGQNQIHIDLSWLTDLQPVIDFCMLTLLFLCLCAMSMRIVELEAAG